MSVAAYQSDDVTSLVDVSVVTVTPAAAATVERIGNDLYIRGASAEASATLEIAGATVAFAVTEDPVDVVSLRTACVTDLATACSTDGWRNPSSGFDNTQACAEASYELTKADVAGSNVHNGLCYVIANFSDAGPTYALAADEGVAFATTSPNVEFTPPGGQASTGLWNRHDDLFMISVTEDAVFECAIDAVNASFSPCGGRAGIAARLCYGLRDDVASMRSAFETTSPACVRPLRRRRQPADAA